MEIKTHEIEEDIVTLSVTADQFPAGVKNAYMNLATRVPDFQSREMYGVAEQLPGGLLYKACVRQNSGEEADKLQVESYTIPKGSYLSAVLHNWQEHMDLFSNYFQQLLSHPEARKNSIGVESYFNSADVLLMVQKEG